MKGFEFFFLAVGSVVGVFLRYKITETQIIFNTLPLNILIVNVVGAFILGLFVVLSVHWNLDAKYFLFTAVGFCGSLTTMSSLALESSQLLENSQYFIMTINLLTNIGLSLGALLAGKSLMAAILNS